LRALQVPADTTRDPFKSSILSFPWYYLIISERIDVHALVLDDRIISDQVYAPAGLLHRVQVLCGKGILQIPISGPCHCPVSRGGLASLCWQDPIW
jgi:hypothetical protein